MTATAPATGTEERKAGWMRYFLELEARHLIRQLCRDARAAARAWERVRARLAELTAADLLEGVPDTVDRTGNPNSLHPWARRRAKAELEPLIRQAAEGEG